MPPYYENGEMVYCYHKDCLYKAKVLSTNVVDDRLVYKIHYVGWSSRQDEWVKDDRLLSINRSNTKHQKTMMREKKAKDQKTSSKKKSSKLVHDELPSTLLSPTRSLMNEGSNTSGRTPTFLSSGQSSAENASQKDREPAESLPVSRNTPTRGRRDAFNDAAFSTPKRSPRLLSLMNKSLAKVETDLSGATGNNKSKSNVSAASFVSPIQPEGVAGPSGVIRVDAGTKTSEGSNNQAKTKQDVKQKTVAEIVEVKKPKKYVKVAVKKKPGRKKKIVTPVVDDLQASDKESLNDFDDNDRPRKKMKTGVVEEEHSTDRDFTKCEILRSILSRDQKEEELQIVPEENGTRMKENGASDAVCLKAYEDLASSADEDDETQSLGSTKIKTPSINSETSGVIKNPIGLDGVRKNVGAQNLGSGGKLVEPLGVEHSLNDSEHLLPEDKVELVLDAKTNNEVDMNVETTKLVTFPDDEQTTGDISDNHSTVSDKFIKNYDLTHTDVPLPANKLVTCPENDNIVVEQTTADTSDYHSTVSDKSIKNYDLTHTDVLLPAIKLDTSSDDDKIVLGQTTADTSDNRSTVSDMSIKNNDLTYMEVPLPLVEEATLVQDVLCQESSLIPLYEEHEEVTANDLPGNKDKDNSNSNENTDSIQTDKASTDSRIDCKVMLMKGIRVFSKIGGTGRNVAQSRDSDVIDLSEGDDDGITILTEVRKTAIKNSECTTNVNENMFIDDSVSVLEETVVTTDVDAQFISSLVKDIAQLESISDIHVAKKSVLDNDVSQASTGKLIITDNNKRTAITDLDGDSSQFTEGLLIVPPVKHNADNVDNKGVSLINNSAEDQLNDVLSCLSTIVGKTAVSVDKKEADFIDISDQNLFHEEEILTEIFSNEKEEDMLKKEETMLNLQKEMFSVSLIEQMLYSCNDKDGLDGTYQEFKSQFESNDGEESKDGLNISDIATTSFEDGTREIITMTDEDNPRYKANVSVDLEATDRKFVSEDIVMLLKDTVTSSQEQDVMKDAITSVMEDDVMEDADDDGAESRNKLLLTSEKNSSHVGMIGGKSLRDLYKADFLQCDQPLAPPITQGMMQLQLEVKELLRPFFIIDTEMIVNRQQLVHLPAAVSCQQILDKYQADGANENHKENPGFELSLMKEFCLGVVDYFNTQLGARLLYNLEREQYKQMTLMQKPFVEIYGSIHLARLLVKLPNLILTPGIVANKKFSSYIRHLARYLRVNINHVYKGSADYDCKPKQVVELGTPVKPALSKGRRGKSTPTKKK